MVAVRLIVLVGGASYLAVDCQPWPSVGLICWFCSPLSFLDSGCQILGVLGRFKGTWFFRLHKNGFIV
jgi:hypothetical protein